MAKGVAHWRHHVVNPVIVVGPSHQLAVKHLLGLFAGLEQFMDVVVDFFVFLFELVVTALN